jgi:uncharacterized repeat protein (TIGR01451 family)/LPXTG-motif cell wall-anchored protein
VNAGSTPITCGGWVCRTGNGSSSTTLAQNALMEGGIDLAAAGFHGCISTFLPHTRSAQQFTATLKDFAGPIAFSNCKQPTIETTQSSSGVTSASSIQVGIGSSVTDTATLHGAASAVGGTISYKLYSNNTCTTQVADGGTKPVSGTSVNGDITLPSSNAVPVNTAGTYYWQATYSGDIASGGSNESVTSNCGDEVLTVVAPSLQITKTADAATVNAGDPIGFTVTVSNTGAGDATGVTLSDPLPTGTGISWSMSPANPLCGIAGGTLSCNFGTLTGNGGSNSVHITSPTVFASCKLYHNTATAGASNVQGTVQASADTTVQCPDLTLTKTADAPTVSAGTNIGFTITAHNNGPGTAKSVTLTDPLPTGSGIVWSESPDSAACNIASNNLSCNFGDMASGATASVHISSPTQFSSCNTYTNTATLHATNHADVTAHDSTTVQCPGLHITKTADSTLVDAGDQIGFGITVSNSGPGTATGVTLTDPLPGGTGVSWSISPAYSGPGSCSIATNAGVQTLNCSFGDMAANASASVHVVSGTANASCGAYPNLATASATNQGSVQAPASITVQCPNLSITKTADAPSVSAGSNIGFTITVHNNGPGVAKSVTLNDPLPTGAGISWSMSPANAACNIASNTLSCSFGDMAAGATQSVHIQSGTDATTVCKVYTNQASAQGTNAPQVTASDSTTVLCPGLHVDKTADNGTVNAGDPIGFTITVSNQGAGTATAATLVDPLPAGNGVNWSISPSYSGAGTCDISGAIGSQTLNCSFGDLAPQASESVHITSATSFASCTTYNNTAIASDTNGPSAQDSASTTVQCPSLSITKVADKSTVSAGQQIGFTITVHNAGPGVAKSVTLNDPLPTGAGISWSMSPANAACNIASNTLSCNFGDMASGATQTVHIVSGTSVDTPCQSYLNTATASSTNHPDVSAHDTVDVQCPGLHITKTADATTVNAGEAIGFTITVSNTGQGTASNVTMSDPLPTGAGVSWSMSPANPDCNIAGNMLTCIFGDMGPDSSASVHVTSATTFASCQQYNNTATAMADNSGGVQASASTTVVCPNLVLTKTADDATVSAGQQIGFTITVSNNGQGTAKSVTITDPLPTGSGIVWSENPDNPDCNIASNTLSCDFGDMASGASASVHVTSPTTLASCKTYNNTATADASNNPEQTAHASTTVQCPALSIVKTADATPVSTTQPIGFTITVSNSNAAGTGTALGVTVNDPLPAGDGVDWSVSPAYSGPGSCSIAGPVGTQVLSCALGDMAPGASASVHIASATTKDSAGTYPNTATAAASNADSVQSTATIVVLPPNLSITKTADATPVSAGDQIGFTVIVANSNSEGTGTAFGVTVNDPLPAGNGVDWSIDTAPAGCSISGAVGSQVLTCTLGDMVPGASASIHIVSATTKDSAGTYPNTATASSSNNDDVQASATIVVQAPALSITKTADKKQVNAGDKIGFTISVSNSDAEGTGVAKSVTLNDPLPGHAGVDWSISPDYSGPGTCSITGTAPTQTLSCAFGDMAPGDSASVHVSSNTTDASVGAYPNTATATASNSSPVEASAEIAVIAVTPETVLATTVPPTTVQAAQELPRTGSNTGPLLWLAFALLGSGLGLAAARRRKVRMLGR